MKYTSNHPFVLGAPPQKILCLVLVILGFEQKTTKKNKVQEAEEAKLEIKKHKQRLCESVMFYGFFCSWLEERHQIYGFQL